MSLGGAATGFGAGAAAGSIIPGVGTLIGGGLGALFGGLLGHGKKQDNTEDKTKLLQPYIDQLQKSSTGLRQQGGQLNDLGQQSLEPAVQIIRNLLSANPQAVMAATAPERGRVIDQYDTARKAITEFGPKGGGTTSALAGSRISEANQLADVVNMGRSNAVNQGLQAGFQATGLGLSADQLASNDLGTIISALLGNKSIDTQADSAKRGQNMAALGGVGDALGSLLGLYLTRKGGAWERGGA